MSYIFSVASEDSVVSLGANTISTEVSVPFKIECPSICKRKIKRFENKKLKTRERLDDFFDVEASLDMINTDVGIISSDEDTLSENISIDRKDLNRSHNIHVPPSDDDLTKKEKYADYFSDESLSSLESISSHITDDIFFSGCYHDEVDNDDPNAKNIHILSKMESTLEEINNKHVTLVDHNTCAIYSVCIS